MQSHSLAPNFQTPFSIQSFSHFPIFPWILSFSRRPPVFYLNSFYINDLTFSRPHVRPHVTPHLRPHLRPPVLLPCFSVDYSLNRSFQEHNTTTSPPPFLPTYLNIYVRSYMRSTWGLRWGLTWGLEKLNPLIIICLAKKTGGLVKNDIIHTKH